MTWTFKKKLLWLREWKDEFEVRDVLEQWIEEYNKHYLHSERGYTPPNRYEKDSYNGPRTLLESV